MFHKEAVSGDTAFLYLWTLWFFYRKKSPAGNNRRGSLFFNVLSLRNSRQSYTESIPIFLVFRTVQVTVR